VLYSLFNKGIPNTPVLALRLEFDFPQYPLLLFYVEFVIKLL